MVLKRPIRYDSMYRYRYFYTSKHLYSYTCLSSVLPEYSRADTMQLSDHLNGDECPKAVWSAHARPSSSSHNISSEHSFIRCDWPCLQKVDLFFQPQNELPIHFANVFSLLYFHPMYLLIAYTVHISFTDFISGSPLQTCQFIIIVVNTVTIRHFFVVPLKVWNVGVLFHKSIQP